ncbi:hypothetical protein ACX84K_23510, partial [Xanthomonas euvesicatoria]
VGAAAVESGNRGDRCGGLIAPLGAALEAVRAISRSASAQPSDCCAVVAVRASTRGAWWPAVMFATAAGGAINV